MRYKFKVTRKTNRETREPSVNFSEVQKNYKNPGSEQISPNSGTAQINKNPGNAQINKNPANTQISKNPANAQINKNPANAQISKNPGTIHTNKKPEKKKNKILPRKVLLFIIIPVVLVSVIIVLSVLLIIRHSSANADIKNSDNYVYILPDDLVISGKDETAEDIILTGIIYSENDSSVAVFRFGSSSYSKKIGEQIGDSGWILYSVSKTSVEISKDSSRKTLYIQTSENT